MLKIIHNDVPMTAKRKRMVECCAFYAKKLGIHKMDATILIAFKYEYTKTFGVYATCEYIETGKVCIEVDSKLHNNILLEIMAHEMVHAKQHLKGELSENKKGDRLWKGKKVSAKLTYSQEPWELEAMRKQAVLNYQYMEFMK